MKKMTMLAGAAGAIALGACAWAQRPEPPAVAQGGPWMRNQARERIEQRGAGLPVARNLPGRPAGEPRPGGVDKGEILKRLLDNPELARRAGVTGDQISRIREGQYAMEKQMIQLRADVQAAELELRHLMEADKTDREAVSKALDTVAAKHTAMRKAEVLRLLDIRETLGRETIEKVQHLVREHLAQRIRQAQERGGPGPARPEGPAPRDRGGRPGAEKDMMPPRGEPRV